MPEGFDSQPVESSHVKDFSLQRLLSSEEGSGAEFPRDKENAQHYFEAPHSSKEANYLEAPASASYLQSNLAALTPESAAAAPNAYNMQSGLSAGSPGKRSGIKRVFSS